MSHKIHPLSDVQTTFIGKNTIIWQYCVILREAVIGDNCNINCGVLIENDVIIGNDVTIKPGVQLWDGLRVGNKVFIGPNVTFTNDLVPRSKVYPEKFKQTVIEEGASIGANATIIAGNTIGFFSFIGAGSLITKPVQPYSVWYGNPATLKGYITRDAVLLNLDLVDKQGRKYTIINNEPILE